ncbi:MULTISPECIES: hypothetical protein [Niastella]|uniref:Outer membrane protein beta-barrel domain-containing protein n=1 Tax=Niastella soli TaxID=2821487 RepID=A0ABS3Z2W7_9BACT|nr:hypothetical protein [Niastella soli]MBO9204516.1 hypothetical protein [Niastella soli]
MQKGFISILIILCWVTGYTQVNKSDLGRPVTSLLSAEKNKARAAKDSLTSSTNKLLHQSPVVPQPGKASHPVDTATPKNTPVIDAAKESDADEPSAFLFERRGCKVTVRVPIYAYVYVPVEREPVKVTEPVKPARIPFLQVHGNFMYNVNYYSNIDTPYNEKNVYQHTVQTYLDVTVKGKYPMRLYLTNRFTNSSLFRNFSDLNLNYNNGQFSQKIKTQVREKFLASLPSPKAPDSLKLELDETILRLRSLDAWIKNPGLLQKMVEAKEKAMRDSLASLTRKPDTVNRMSLVDSAMVRLGLDSLEAAYALRKQQIDSLRARIVVLERLIKTAKGKSQESINKTVREIDQAKSPAQLKKVMEENHIADTILPKGYKTLMAIRSFGVGRTVVNYSELSAKNISVKGFQTEYNPDAYYALATGSVDYRFRDFIVKGPKQSGQYLTVLRYGRGLKDGNNVIFTWFGGKRQLYNAGTVDTVQNTPVQTPPSGLMGFTVEGNYRLTKNITFTAEVAKSSYPVYAKDSTDNTSLPAQMLELSNRHNEAYSLKADAAFPKTQTTVRSTFKRLGANFQSFSTFTDGSAQTAWSASVQQLFFKRQLTLMLGANTNDFSNPFIGSQYKSTTVFKSLQATWRRNKWPVISAGYFPSSQITKLGDGLFRENLFYTLTGNVTHTYKVRDLMMNSALVYTQFYNRSTDSGFVYFNTKNLLLSQAVFINQLTLQTNASGAFNQDYRLYTLEQRATYNINKYVMIGAGLKYNYQTTYKIEQLGYSAETTFQVPKLGQIQFSAEKGFIPGMNKQLVPNNTGRATYFKTF